MLSNILRYQFSLIRPVYEKTSFHKSVIEEIADPEMKRAYTVCRTITKQYAKTFYMATRFLPNEKQRHIFAIYSLCRCLDNLVDEIEDQSHSSMSIPQILEQLEQWKYELKMVYENRYYGSNPVLKAFSDTLSDNNISIDLPLLLIEGISTDLTKKRYENFQEVYDYAYKVASVVGLMISEVFGYSDEKALEHALQLGIAMQLTNILRDVGEDLGRNRIYLPADEMRQFHITEESLFAHDLSYDFIEFMQFQIRRARNYYDLAEPGILMLSADSRLPVYLAHQNYSAILDRIEENGYQVFTQRAYLTKGEKLTKLPRTWWLCRG